jgi:2-iminobutanoate/2-iminopropanoate deaminase
MPTNQPATIRHLEPTEFQKSRAFSPAVLTQGGTTVWLAGQTTLVDLDGKPIPGDFDAQAKTIFALIGKTLERAGGSLANLVTMTVFIKDPRHGDQFVALRGEVFAGGPFPASALITVAHFAKSDIMLEIQGVAVI